MKTIRKRLIYLVHKIDELRSSGALPAFERAATRLQRSIEVQFGPTFCVSNTTWRYEEINEPDISAIVQRFFSLMSTDTTISSINNEIAKRAVYEFFAGSVDVDALAKLDESVFSRHRFPAYIALAISGVGIEPSQFEFSSKGMHYKFQKVDLDIINKLVAANPHN